MIDIQIIDKPTSEKVVREIAKNQFGDMVKFVVDVKKEIIAIGGDLHADEEALLIEQGSSQEDLWGINYYIDKTGKDQVEFDSMINIRPSQGNRSRDVENSEIREKIIAIVKKLIRR
ncbi:MAG: DUF5674 family protein [Patescibacteria group bacterium]|nr:DUF5674 family protein [Patescibacteria group bacterium]